MEPPVKSAIYPNRQSKIENRKFAGIAAFSLVELLVVIAMIGILAMLAASSFNTLDGHTVTQQGQILNDQINLTRQLAVSRNREMELRLISYAANNGVNWALQICESSSDPQNARAFSRLVRLADGTVIDTSPQLSPLLAHLETASAAFPTLGTCAYQALKFRPNGRVKGSFPAKQDYLTLRPRCDPSDHPANYFTLQIQSVTGRISVYRP